MNRFIYPTQRNVLLTLFLIAVALSGGCGQSAPPVTSPATGSVNNYFGGPFTVAGSSLARSSSSFDHSANQIGVSALVVNQTAQVPTSIMNGTFTAADTGFLSVTENFATTSSGVISPQNPPLTGAWAVEIPGAGALANLLSVNTSATPTVVKAAPSAMATNSTCPQFLQAAEYLYVTVPNTGLNSDTADYGSVSITTQGSAVTFNSSPYVIGPLAQPLITVTGGCSVTNLGALTAYPLNSYGTSSNLELITMGAAGLLASSYNAGSSSSIGAFGGSTGIIGVAQPSGPVDASVIAAGQYNGFIYAPSNTVPETYDITVLAAAFGNHTASSPSCTALQSSLEANHGQGSNSIPQLPSANSLYGGEFLVAGPSGNANDPNGSLGSENCDVVIDLGTEDESLSGLFPHATVFIGSNYPPFSISNPWTCLNTGGTCAVSFPAAAVVGNVQGRNVIFIAASAASNPAAQLPNSFGGSQAQPIGIYLFQKK